METKKKSYELTKEGMRSHKPSERRRALQEEEATERARPLNAYRELVDETIDEVVPQLITTAQSLLEGQGDDLQPLRPGD